MNDWRDTPIEPGALVVYSTSGSVHSQIEARVLECPIDPPNQYDKRPYALVERTGRFSAGYKRKYTERPSKVLVAHLTVVS